MLVNGWINKDKYIKIYFKLVHLNWTTLIAENKYHEKGDKEDPENSWNKWGRKQKEKKRVSWGLSCTLCVTWIWKNSCLNRRVNGLIKTICFKRLRSINFWHFVLVAGFWVRELCIKLVVQLALKHVRGQFYSQKSVYKFDSPKSNY